MRFVLCLKLKEISDVYIVESNAFACGCGDTIIAAAAVAAAST